MESNRIITHKSWYEINGQKIFKKEDENDPTLSAIHFIYVKNNSRQHSQKPTIKSDIFLAKNSVLMHSTLIQTQVDSESKEKILYIGNSNIYITPTIPLMNLVNFAGGCYAPSEVSQLLKDNVTNNTANTIQKS